MRRGGSSTVTFSRPSISRAGPPACRRPSTGWWNAPLRRFVQDANKGELTLEVTKYKTSWGHVTFMVHLEMLAGTSSFAAVYAATADNGLGRTAAAQKTDAALNAATTVHMEIVNMDYAQIFDVQSPQLEVLPNGGGGPKGAVDALWINAITNPQAHGAIYTVVA